MKRSEHRMLDLPGKAVGWEDDDIIMAGSKGKGWPLHAGRLIYFKGANRAVAHAPIFLGIKESLKGRLIKKQKLLDENGIIKPEPMMLYALKEEASMLDRGLAFSLLQASMKKQGDPFSEAEIQRQSNIATDREKYEEFIGEWLVNVVVRDGAQGLRILADWIDDFNKHLERPISKEDQDFIEAVEKAAVRCAGVPTQKDVRQLWESGSAGRAQDHRFRQTRDRVGFSWLPPGRRGASAH